LPFCHAHLNGSRPLPRAYPQVLLTIGDHLRKRRLDLGLLQREIADKLGVTESTVTNWELNRTTPALRFLPHIITLLAFDPSAPGGSLGERLRSTRRRVGLSQGRAARLLGVDPGTLSRWERNLRVPTGRYVRSVEFFVERFTRTEPLPVNYPTDVLKGYKTGQKSGSPLLQPTFKSLRG
jgi:transcriptional regulator with XRE-family HTH domain